MFRRFKRSASEWCCAGFQGHYDSAGDRGFAVLVERDDDSVARFLIQSRAVAKGDQARLKIASADVPVGLVTETGLTFCPWCGVNLRRFYAKRIDELDRPDLSIHLPTSLP
jgi:hypothetical protein